MFPAEPYCKARSAACDIAAYIRIRWPRLVYSLYRVLRSRPFCSPGMKQPARYYVVSLLEAQQPWPYAPRLPNSFEQLRTAARLGKLGSFYPTVVLRASYIHDNLRDQFRRVPCWCTTVQMASRDEPSKYASRWPSTRRSQSLSSPERLRKGVVLHQER